MQSKDQLFLIVETAFVAACIQLFVIGLTLYVVSRIMNYKKARAMKQAGPGAHSERHGSRQSNPLGIQIPAASLVQMVSGRAPVHRAKPTEKGGTAYMPRVREEVKKSA